MKKAGLAVLVMLMMAVMAPPALAQSGQMGLSAFGGWAIPLSSNPMEGRDGYDGPDASSFKSTWTVGIEAYYGLPNGLTFGLGLQYLDLTAKATGPDGGGEVDFAKLSMTPIYLLVKYQQPVRSGLTWHVEAGLGYNLASVSKSYGITDMETALGESISVDAKNKIMFLAGAGLDYFFQPNVSVGASLRYWYSKVDVDMTGATSGVLSRNTYNAQNIQVLVGVTFWFSTF